MTKPTIPGQDDHHRSGWETYKRLVHYVAPHWYAFVVSFIGFTLYAASQTAFAKWMEYMVETLEQGLLDQRGLVAGAIILIFVVRGVGTFLGQYGIAYAARHLVHRMRTEMFNQLLRLPCAFYQQEASGQILSRLTFNVEQVTGAATDALRVTIREGLTVLGLFGYLLYLNWKLTLVFIAAGPFIVAAVAFASKRFRTLSHRIQDSIGDVTHTASEAIKGYEVVRIFGGAEVEQQRFIDVSEHNRKQFMKMVVTQAINTPVVQLLVALALALLVYMAMSPALLADMSTGEFIAFITAAGMIAKPLRQMTEVNAIIQRGIAAAQSLFDLIDLPAEPDSGDRTLARADGRLSLEHVSFRYEGSDHLALDDINLQVEPGQSVALVGRSGSGKTTLANLLPRFFDPTEGAIRLDGIPLTELKLDELRRQIALVNQQVVLFEGSIADNIAYGALKNAPREAIEAAAVAAHVDEFAARMPDGLDTLVGENGVMLSGGQRQRIAIARAILKNAPLLILDEATSALDTESERHIQAALEHVMEGRTTLVIAHRLSTIERADLIVVMDRGKIVEQGNHQQLLELDGAYAALHRMQFSEPAGGF
ncbi:lipid A export permease/ATP-binding protein MsbA [Marinobacterium arenosum]|uniref:lipid A export permease/ATP-binding protein MsbA n=1 Tax=Marinobacterium arenosum TaxID=2862496 RepID=UPI001C967218|nr:lipid A export permease/ATP-binding protein MsbA [Marinobacterium arenosum]MBY4676433.1 lipid A export permease/ATP-binding protein MsbA [Marinobacterium arenosum]